MSGPAKASRFDRSLIEGPIVPAVWKIAWPTMLQNVIAGLQGMIDHAMVGHYVGYTGNAAIGVSWQIFLVVIVFVSSLFTGMGILVARFAGAGEPEKVNRVVYQAFLTAVFLACGVLAPIGYLASPMLLDLVHATAEVKREALPFLRIMFVCSIGMLLFFMLGGALRAAGDARTPLRLGVIMTALTILLNIVFIGGLGPVPALGTMGAAVGSVIASGCASLVGLWLLFSDRLVVHFSRSMSFAPDWTIIRSLFKFGLPTGFQGVAMNVAGVLLLRFVGSLEHSAEAQAAYAVGYTQLFSLITWSSVGLMGAASALAGQNLGAKRPDRAELAVNTAARLGLTVAAIVGVVFIGAPRFLLAIFGMHDPAVLEIARSLLIYLSISGLFITTALTYQGGLQGTGDTKGPLYITMASQIVIPLGYCTVMQSMGPLQPTDIWLAIVLGHVTRGTLSMLRFRQGRWRTIAVDIEPART